MKPAKLCAIATLCVATVLASGYVTIYSRVDKVIFEPSAEHPERIQVFGAFSMGTGPKQFLPVQHGYLYFKLPQAGGGQVLKEWQDLKAVSGTGTVVGFGVIGFGATFPKPPVVHNISEKPADPEVYPLGQGVSKVNANTDYAPIKSLLDGQ
jgi:hypothetical protein